MLDITVLRLINITRIPPEEDNRHQPHQKAIEHIERPLVPQQIPVLTHGILDHPENTAHHDQRTHHIEHIQILLPPRLDLIALPGRRPANAHVEHQSRDAKQAKHDDLDEQAGDNHVLARLHVRAVAGGHQARGAALHEERQHVARDEELREPGGPDRGERGAADGEDDAREGHVDGGGEEGGGDEDEGVLDDVGHELVGFVVGAGAGGVAYYFDWGGGVSGEKGTGGREGGRWRGEKAGRTEASDGEGDAEPGSGLVDFPHVKEGGDDEEDGEDDGGGDGWEVEPELVAVQGFELSHRDVTMP